MKTKSFLYLLASTCLILMLTTNCQKEETKIKDPDIKDPLTNPINVKGLVQKGPFVNGTSILMSELNSALGQTGNTFTTQILNNSGLFEISDIILSSGFVEFSATGFYFDEVKGQKSIAPLNLLALSDITDSAAVNINILTHLEKLRVKYLVEHNKTFSEAKKMAQAEILAIFDFELSEMNNSETLDISVNNESNAILLAISIILQGNFSVGDLTEQLANITNDIREDGVLNDETIMTNLRNSVIELDLAGIRANLVFRYQQLGIIASIPDFEKYIQIFLEFTSKSPVVTTLEESDLDGKNVTLNGLLDPGSLSTIVSFEYGPGLDYGYSVYADQSPLKGNSSVAVSASLTDLNLGTEYHYRIVAQNAHGIAYGEDNTFITAINGMEGTVSDIDGNTYKTIAIGYQIWMAENLRVTKFNDGSSITKVTDSLTWMQLETPGFAWNYFNPVDNYNSGGYYNWYSVNTKKLCPLGWNLPDTSALMELQEYLGDWGIAGGKLKSDNFAPPNTGATNETGFSAEPYGLIRSDGFSEGYSYYGYWWGMNGWENNQAMGWKLSYNNAEMEIHFDSKKSGLSVRCLKDD